MSSELEKQIQQILDERRTAMEANLRGLISTVQAPRANPAEVKEAPEVDRGMIRRDGIGFDLPPFSDLTSKIKGQGGNDNSGNAIFRVVISGIIEEWRFNAEPT